MTRVNLSEEEQFCSVDMSGNSQRMSILLAGLASRNPELTTEEIQHQPKPQKCEVDDFLKIVRKAPFYELDSDDIEERNRFCDGITQVYEIARLFGMFESSFIRDYNKYRTTKDRRMKVKYISRAAATLRMIEALFTEGKKRGIVLRSTFI